MMEAVDVRARIVETLRRDLIGPGPQDADIRDERLKENPSRWYLAGYLAPAPDGAGDGADEVDEEGDPLFGADEGADPETGRARAADDPPADEPAARKVRAPSSCGLTVLIDASVKEIEVHLRWGDYITIPPVPETVFVDQAAQFDPAYRTVQWQRVPGEATIRLPVPENGRAAPIVAPDSAGRQRPSGALVIEAHARPYTLQLADGAKQALRALTVTMVNRRKWSRGRFADVAFAFQVRLQARCASGLFPRSDMTGFGSRDPDAALADLHYASVAEYAIGCNASAGWTADPDGVVRTAFTDFFPTAEVERVEPNEKITGVEFEMEALAALAASGADTVADTIKDLPRLYEDWIASQEAGIPAISGPPRQAAATRLIASARHARDRIAAGVELLRTDADARLAFRAMNEAVARAARQRDAILNGGDPAAQKKPKWRPFQLAFILLNLCGLQNPLHSDSQRIVASSWAV